MKPLIKSLTFLGFLFIGCTTHPTEPSRFERDMYVISIPATGFQDITFSYTVHEKNRFILPFHYFDNPLDSVNGQLVKNLSIIDAGGNQIDTFSEDSKIGPVINKIITLPDNTLYPVTFSWQLDLSVLFRDSLNKDMPRIFCTESSFFLIGAYWCIIPELGASTGSLWRSKYPVQITVCNESILPVYGIPDTTFICSNIYELIFLQLSSSPRIVASGHGGGIDFIFTDFTNNTYSPQLSDSVSLLFSAILDKIVSIYGSISGSARPSMPYTVSVQSLWGACEGTYGFVTRGPHEGTDGRFGEILAHEALHHFIGIRCGEYDDPWWKEATASYLGLETAVSLGFYTKASFRQRMTTLFWGADSSQFQIALSNPLLRDHLFSDMLYPLAYERGCQVMMLLDVSIRKGSGNRYTLHNVMSDLCRRFTGNAFGRSDFTAALTAFGAENVSDIFTTWVDNPDSVMQTEYLQSLFTTLDSMAAW